jgi:hypothetical protein
MFFSGERMSTRCCIEISYRGRRYRIYRHSDGYPQGVIADLYVLMNNYDRDPSGDPEYFLANFIFYAKLARWIEELRNETRPPYNGWEYGYGVCSPDCEHGDLEYRYVIEGQNVRIEEYEWESRGWRTVFTGTMEEAYKTFCSNTPYADGCHIPASLFPTQKLLAAI